MAREKGLAQLTLRDVAERVGMKAPSLYSHVDSKNAIYDAMYAEAWAACHEEMTALEARCPRTSAERCSSTHVRSSTSRSATWPASSS